MKRPWKREPEPSSLLRVGHLGLWTRHPALEPRETKHSFQSPHTVAIQVSDKIEDFCVVIAGSRVLWVDSRAVRLV